MEIRRSRGDRGFPRWDLLGCGIWRCRIGVGMASKMMRWRPWPPLPSKKFQVKLVVKRVEGVGAGDEAAGSGRKIVAEVRWKGPKLSLSSLRRTAKRNRTREEEVSDGGMVEWNEEFETVCTLTAQKENAFHPREVFFSVFNVSRSQSLNCLFT